MFLKFLGSICFLLFAWNVSVHWGNRTRSSEKLLEIVKWFITESQQPSMSTWEPGWQPKTAGIAGSHLRCFPWFRVFLRKSKQERIKPVCSWLQLQNRKISKLLLLSKEGSGSLVCVYGKSQTDTFWTRRQHSFTSPALPSLNETLSQNCRIFFTCSKHLSLILRAIMCHKRQCYFFHRIESVMITISDLAFKLGLLYLESKWKVRKKNLSILWKFGLSTCSDGSF